MKKIIVYISLFCFPFRLFNCPLCVGKVKSDSPPFFSDDLYQSGKSEQLPIKEQYAHEEFKKLGKAKKGKL